MLSRVVEEDEILFVELLVWVGTEAVRICRTLELVSLLFVGTTGHTRNWSDSDVLSEEVLSRKVVHKVLRSDEAAIFFVLLDLEGLKLLADSLGNFLEQISKRLLANVSRDVLSELLIDLSDYLRAPAADLIVDEVDLAAELVGGLFILRVTKDLLVEGLDLGRVRLVLVIAFLAELLILVVVLHLQVVQLRCERLVVATKLVRLALVLADGGKELRVGLLTSQELGDDLVHVGVASLGFDLLESILDVTVPVHLGAHLFL